MLRKMYLVSSDHVDTKPPPTPDTQLPQPKVAKRNKKTKHGREQRTNIRTTSGLKCDAKCKTLISVERY